MNDNVKYMIMFLALGAVTVVAITVVHTVKAKAEEHDDHVDLAKTERDAWYELVNNYHSH
jgi:hypothetical protein